MYVNYLWKRDLPMLSESVDRLPDDQLIPPSSPDTKKSRNSSDSETNILKRVLQLFTALEENSYSEAALQLLPSVREEWPQSECNCHNSESQCTVKNECPNALNKVECNANNCAARDKGCVNRSMTEFQADETVRIKVAPVKTLNRGYGLRTDDEIDPGALVLELMGEVVTHAEANQCLVKSLQNKNHEPWTPEDSTGEAFLIHLTHQLSIDFTNSGNLSRLINHSCDPNLRAVSASPQSPKKKESRAQSPSPDKPARKVCKTLASNVNSEATQLMAKPSAGRKEKVKEEMEQHKEGDELHEDFCFRCGDGGELILCDKTTCSKAYHLNCVGLAKPPSGIWYCPWHYCDDCGRPSSRMCWRCPNSFCEKHGQDESKINVEKLDEERWEQARGLLTIVGVGEEMEADIALRNMPIILSCRWICADHKDLNISGSGSKPVLALKTEDDDENATPRPKKRKTLVS
ncbi:Histone-lysine N-methyltransferase NSD3 [Cichlidogyrus casuarinus]|uniref:Histone-lysine N-methyltransferase NSD3 n=1 Tax=Cichlidogyrus casuarinus TaxID=1844966 RepID=A0ABD2QFW1_9PLAT